MYFRTDASMAFFLYLLLFAVLQNVDNFVLAVAYRWQKIEIPLSFNLLIAGLSALFTAVGIVAANVTNIEAAQRGWNNYAEVLGRGLLVMMGTWTLIGYFRTRLFPKLNLPDSEGMVLTTTSMKGRDAFLVGTALAVDNLGPSFAFGLVNRASLGVGLTLTVLTGIVSVIFVALGVTVGANGQQRLSRLSPKLVTGCLILGIALFDPGDIARNAFFSF